MKTKALVVSLAAALPAWGHAATPTSPLIAQAKKVIGAEMVDPGSLPFRNLRVVKATVQGQPLSIACGEYNAKNKMGGYTGFAQFAYEPTVLRGALSLTAEQNIQGFGGAGQTHDTDATRANATILAACLGIPM